jgi:hypothetical protein
MFATSLKCGARKEPLDSRARAQQSLSATSPTDLKYDVQEILNALRLSYEHEFKRKPDQRTLLEALEQTIARPPMMPSYMRAWLRTFSLKYENDTISWLRMYAHE